MNTDPNYWLETGKADRNAGNSQPGLTPEDFYREIEDPTIARQCAEAYQAGFETHTSYAPEVVADSSGNFNGNALRFATYDEAWNYAQDLASRWTLVRDMRVVGSADSVNYRWVNGRAERIEA